MSDDVQLAVTEWGDGPTVVLVHGGTPEGGAVAFRAQRPLEARWHLILPDRPGHGGTPRLGREDFARDASLVAPLLGAAAHLVGHSYGGMVALCLALQRPEAVRSLTLIEPPAYSLAPDDPAVVEMQRANRALFEHPPADHAELVGSFFRLVGIDVPVGALPPPALDRLASDLADMRSPHEAVIDPEELATGGYPILVLTSGRTPAFEAIAGTIAERAGATHTVVPGTGHAVQDAGEPVNELLEELWSRAGVE